MTNSPFFEPLQLGALHLPNRVVMAPLTRMRAAANGMPTPLMADYYSQRASAGLIITEGTAVSTQAHGYPASPGIYTVKQLAGWRNVTDRVHALQGRIIMQIQHNGRGSLPVYNADGSPPVAPSSSPYVGKVYTPSFEPQDPPAPRALEAPEILRLVKTFTQAASNAMTAGFDGVEIQGANGHLIDQFLSDGSNRRSDNYGGSIANRARFLLDIVDSTIAVVGANRIGVRLSPFGRYGGISDSEPHALFSYVLHELSTRHIAYVHMIEARGSENGISRGRDPPIPRPSRAARRPDEDLRFFPHHSIDARAPLFHSRDAIWRPHLPGMGRRLPRESHLLCNSSRS